MFVVEVSEVGKTEGPRFSPRPCRGMSFGGPSFATPSVDRDVKSLVQSLGILLGELK